METIAASLFFTAITIFTQVKYWLLRREAASLYLKYEIARTAASLGGIQVLTRAPGEFVRVELRTGSPGKLINLESGSRFNVFLFREETIVDATTIVSFVSGFLTMSTEEGYHATFPITQPGVYQVWLGRPHDQPKVVVTVTPLPDSSDGRGGGPQVFQTT